jgi:HEAT repeat protein
MWWLYGMYGLYILAAGGLAVASTREMRKRQQVRRQAFQDTVKLCGMQMVSTSKPRATRLKLEATAGPVTLRVEDIQDKKREYGINVVVSFPGPPGFSGVRIRPEKYRPAGVREIEIGDERFDSLFFIEGPARLLTVLLDAETRRILASVSTEGRLLIVDNEFRLETWDSHFADVLSLFLDLIRRFSEEVDVAERLATNVRQDSVAGVRLRNLLALVRDFPGEPRTVETLRAACSDASPQVRLQAAMALGAEGRGALTELAASLEDDGTSAQAVAHLGRELPFEPTRALLAQALRRRRLQTARACLDALGQSGDAAAVDALAKVLAIEKGELAAAAAMALGATGSPAAEPPLLAALQREKEDLRIAAANALGRAGSPTAVLPLKEAAEEASPELRRAARQAIAEIQSRLQGASPGQLSLAGPEAGQLSLADTEAGQLSLATDPAGQVSLAQADNGLRGLPLGEASRGTAPDV